MKVSACAQVETIPTAQRQGWRWLAGAAVLGRRLVIGLGSLAVFGVESPGTWLALAGVGLSYALECGLLPRWEGISEWAAILLLAGAGIYGLLLLRP